MRGDRCFLRSFLCKDRSTSETLKSQTPWPYLLILHNHGTRVYNTEDVARGQGEWGVLTSEPFSYKKNQT